MKHLIAMAAAAILTASPKPPCIASGPVTDVHDGDTFTVWIAAKPEACKPDVAGLVHIRIARVDAPELDQQHGKASRDRLKEILTDSKTGELRDVTMTITARSYGRLVAESIGVSRGTTDLEGLLVSEGIAWHYATPALLKKWKGRPPPRDAALATAQAAARAQRKGLWGVRINIPPTAPWVWRRERGR